MVPLFGSLSSSIIESFYTKAGVVVMSMRAQAAKQMSRLSENFLTVLAFGTFGGRHLAPKS